MGKKILVIQGHPESGRTHLCHVLAQAYARGAAQAGHEVRTVSVADLGFPVLRSKDEWEHAPLPDALVGAQQAIAWADHLALFFPLWLGGMPALLKAFLEQVARPGFAVAPSRGIGWKRLLTGRSARLVVTMGMPAPIYRWYFRAHSIKALERNILGFVGIAPIRETLIGSVESLGAAGSARWIDKLDALGRRAA